MIEIYKCEDCEKYFTYDEIGEKQICYEEEYGVASDFNSRTYDSVNCCPHCKSTNISECSDDEEIVKYLNNYVDKTPMGQKLLYDDLISKPLVIVGGTGVWFSNKELEKKLQWIKKYTAREIVRFIDENQDTMTTLDILNEIKERYGVK